MACHSKSARQFWDFLICTSLICRTNRSISWQPWRPVLTVKPLQVQREMGRRDKVSVEVTWQWHHLVGWLGTIYSNTPPCWLGKCWQLREVRYSDIFRCFLIRSTSQSGVFKGCSWFWDFCIYPPCMPFYLFYIAELVSSICPVWYYQSQLIQDVWFPVVQPPNIHRFSFYPRPLRRCDGTVSWRRSCYTFYTRSLSWIPKYWWSSEAHTAEVDGNGEGLHFHKVFVHDVDESYYGFKWPETQATHLRSVLVLLWRTWGFLRSFDPSQRWRSQWSSNSQNDDTCIKYTCQVLKSAILY